MIVSLGLPLFFDNVYDVACLAVDGRIAGFTAKDRYRVGPFTELCGFTWFGRCVGFPLRVTISCWVISTSIAADRKLASRFAKTRGSQSARERSSRSAGSTSF